MLGTRFFNSPEGIAFLPEGLARQVPVELSATATGIEERRDSVTVEWQRPGEPGHRAHARAVVIAVAAPQVRGIFPSLTQPYRAYLDGLTHNPMFVVKLGLAKPPPEPAAWIVVPRQQHGDLIEVVLDHNKAPGRTPHGQGLVSTYWNAPWVRSHWAADDQDVIRAALEGLDRLGLFPGLAADVTLTHVQRWQAALPRRAVGTFRAQPPNGACSRNGRVHLAGDYFSVPCTHSSLSSGERAAHNILQTLNTP
ncbi:hypothetical protein [Streptomyces daliensis]|uniref:FAD-dependent oxidoreductase n=1 Tax=Streptomyces daliensis TaxID=299421 RepID=A0A8T4IZH4_9ACTN|nr:FAD-dependent oxidoreductase [Streptomyces daliensis]